LIEHFPDALIQISLVVLLASFIQSLTGFGFAIISVPILVLFIDPKIAVQISLILGFVLSAVALLMSRRKVGRLDLRWPLLVGSLVGIPIGGLVLKFISPLPLRLLVSGAGMVIAFLFFRGFSIEIVRQNLAFGVVGVISGILNSTTSMGGVVVALFLTNTGFDNFNLRSNMLVYLLVTNMVTILTLFITGTLTSPVLLLSLDLIPVITVGLLIGAWLFARVSRKAFTNIVLAVVIVASISGFVSSVLSYLSHQGL
jgi:hypothetical protein